MINKDSYVDLLFRRFGEIYGSRSGLIQGSRNDWSETLQNCKFDDIRKALDDCRSDPSILITLEVFRELLGKPPKTDISDNSLIDSRPKEAIRSDLTDLQLIAMDDSTAAVMLSAEQQYDRTRLLMAKDGNDQAKRYEAIATLNKEEKTAPRKSNSRTSTKDYY